MNTNKPTITDAFITSIIIKNHIKIHKKQSIQIKNNYIIEQN